MTPALDETILQDACRWLAERDTAMALVLHRYGYPPLWAREPGFPTLVHIILEQQVSLASANAAFAKLKEHTGQISPASLLLVSDEEMLRIGFSRQKKGYARALAEAVVQGDFDFETLPTLPDPGIRAEMTRLKGIGHWTADIYLLMCLLRPDILPKGDIALLEAFRVLYHLPQRPAHDVFESATQHWRPWRSVGARMLWHFYLCERGR